MRYLITGCGRSGTASMASYLSCVHELDSELQLNPALVQERFDAGMKRAGRYGECSSYLVACAAELRVEVLAVIVRHPIRLVLSLMNRKPPTQWQKAMDTLIFQLEHVVQLWGKADVRLRFEKLQYWEHRAVLAGALERAGPLRNHNWPHVNKTREFRFDSVPRDMAAQVQRYTDLFYPDRADHRSLFQLEGL